MDRVEERYLTASEVGNFTYCPEAWYLQRFGSRPDDDAIRRLHAGARAHQQIGRTTDRLASTDALRRGLLVVLVVLAALLVASSMGWLSLAAPR